MSRPCPRAVCPRPLALILAAGAACVRPDVPVPAPPAAGTSPAAASATSAGLTLEGARMAADIAFLASDELRGRFTLSPDLRVAAEFLAARYQELGLVPVGPAFAVEFPLTTGARATRAPGVAVTRGGKARPLPAGSFAPVAQSASGTAAGPLVFVGYAARSEVAAVHEDGPPDPAGPAYDDLAGVDLQGKVALVLLEVPGRPDPMKLYTRLRDLGDRFNAEAAPLKAAGDADRLRALHAGTRGKMVEMLSAFVPAERLAGVWPLPEDPRTVEFELGAVAKALMAEAAKLPGPQFGFGEGALRTKVERLTKAGAVGVILVRGPRSFLTAEERAADELPTLDGLKLGEALPVPVVQVQWKTADALLGAGKQTVSKLQARIDADRRPRSGPVAGVTAEISVALDPVTAPVPNVLASLPGTDLAQEVVMIGAHYDHIGKAGEGEGECNAVRKGEVVDEICNGADDNASGTAMVLELARAWKQRPPPRRTIVFTHFAGEEMGILGSKALAEAPPFDLKRVVAMINLDMVGRLGPKGLAIGGLGSSDAWLPLLDEVGTAGLDILYEGSVATRSDHASFYRKDIPVLFFFTGTHADYHRPGDTADKINLPGMLAIGEIVGGVMLRLGDGRAVPWKPPGPGGGLAAGLPGSDPKTIVKRVKAG